MNHRSFSEVYRSFEDRFRGDRDLISQRLRTYEPLVQAIPEENRKKAIDLGSGRGEWLALVREWGFHEAVGVEPDVSMHEYAAPGVEVEATDALTYLERIPDGSVQLITAFHVIEHVTADYGFRMICEIHRVLADNGVLILETPNPENLMVGLWSFHLDPTHNRPIPPVLLDFLVDEAGFKDHSIVRLNGVLPASSSNSIIARLVHLSPDYSVIAVKSTENREKCQTFTLKYSQASPADYGELIKQEQLFDETLKKLRSEADENDQLVAPLQSKNDEVSAQLYEQISHLFDAQHELDKRTHGITEEMDHRDRVAIQRSESVRELVTLKSAETDAKLVAAVESIENFAHRLKSAEEKLAATAVERENELSAFHEQLNILRMEAQRHLSEAENLARQRDAILNSRSWRITSPLRRLSHLMLGRNIDQGATSSDGTTISRAPSRTERLARSAVVRGFAVVSRFPALMRMLRPFVNKNPLLKRKLQALLVPQHLVDAMTPFRPADGTTGRPLARGEQIVNDRLAWAKTMLSEGSDQPTADELETSEHASERLSLAYLSPMPPDRSGIADYSAQLLPELQRLYDVTVVTVLPEEVSPQIRDSVDVRNVEWFEQNAGRFDRIVYHFGNSLFHHHMLPLLRRIPGVVVLHDFYLSGMLAHLELYGGWGPVWSSALFHSHGYSATIERLDPELLDYVINTYPVSFEVIEQATGVITHSRFSRELGAQFYPACGAQDWKIVPLCRAPLSANERLEARAALHLDENDFVVCSFGFIGYTKLNHRLLDAWLASGLANNKRCKLYFVGAAHEDAYSTDLLHRIKKYGDGRVTVTGFVDSDHYRKYLNAADVGVQLRSVSRGETSAAVLDCMAYGLPTIVNANGSMAELPAEGVYLLEDEFKDIDLQSALLDLFEDSERRQALGRTAGEYIAKYHSASAAANGYYEAIEAFYQKAHPAFNHRRLLELLPNADEGDQDSSAPFLGLDIGKPKPANRVFVDVSALVREDLRSGIQRVVRATLVEMFQRDLDGYRLEPVWLNNDNAEWRYYHARNFSFEFLSGKPVSFTGDDPVEVSDGDIFLGVDFFAHGIVGAHKQGMFDEWRRKNVRIAFVVYDILPLTLPDRFPDDSTRMHALWMEALAEVADQLICISGAVADEVRGYLDQTRKSNTHEIDIVPWALGADIHSSSPTKGMSEADRRNLKLVSRGRSFLMVGTIEPRKGHRDILKAFEHRWAAGSTDLLVLVGSAGWKGVPISQSRGLPDTIRMIQDHPENGKRLIWFSSATDELLEEVYKEATVLIAASEGEGFGLPLVEAAQRELPIIARDIPVFREVAGEHAFFYRSTTSELLAAEIDHWVDLYDKGSHPRSSRMPWLTWKDSTNLLWRLLRSHTVDKSA